MTTVDSKLITTVEMARSLFGEDLLAKVKSATSSDQQAVIAEIKSQYKQIGLSLKSQIANSIAERKAQFNDDKVALDNELQTSVKAIDDRYSQLSIEERNDKTRVKEYKDEINGVKTVHQRSLKKLSNEYDLDVVTIKSQQVLVCRARNILIAEAKGKTSDGLGLNTAILNVKASFNFKKFITNTRMWKSFTPFLVLVALFVAYVIACNVTHYKLNIDTILTSGIYVAIVAVGAVFIYSQGAFDMSLGNATLICAALGIMTYAQTGSIFFSFILAVVLGVILGIVNALLANYLRLPVMVMTLTMQSVLSAIYANMTADSGGYIEVPEIRGIGGMTMKWIILIAFIVFCVVMFNYTKVGRRNKMIGANATCAKFSGISLMKAGIVAFAISGIGLGLCGFLYITQTGSVNTGTALTSIGLNVIIAINLGGMPTSGGPKSKISAAIIGGFFCTILDEFFAAIGLDLYRFLAKGVIFLIAVYLTSLGDRPKRLA